MFTYRIPESFKRLQGSVSICNSVLNSAPDNEVKRRLYADLITDTLITACKENVKETKLSQDTTIYSTDFYIVTADELHRLINDVTEVTRKSIYAFDRL